MAAAQPRQGRDAPRVGGNSPIKAEDLSTEFSVVRNEFEMGENSPESVLSQRMAAVAFEWHN